MRTSSPVKRARCRRRVIRPEQAPALYRALRFDFVCQLTLRCPTLPCMTIMPLATELALQAFRTLGLRSPAPSHQNPALGWPRR